MLRVKNLGFIVMSTLLIYIMFLVFNYSKLNSFILIHCGLYINFIALYFNTLISYSHTKTSYSHILSFLHIPSYSIMNKLVSW